MTLEVDASHINSNEHLTQGNTESLLQKQPSFANFNKPTNRHNDDCSFGETNLSNLDLSRELSLRQADVFHTSGWEARKKQEFRKAIECYTKAI